MENIILEELFELLKDCGYCEDGIYFKYSDNEEPIDDFVKNFFIQRGINYVKTNITEAFDSPGYNCSVLSVAWFLDKKLYLETFLLEAY